MEMIFPQHELLLMNYRIDPHKAVYYNIKNMKKSKNAVIPALVSSMALVNQLTTSSFFKKELVTDKHYVFSGSKLFKIQ